MPDAFLLEAKQELERALYATLGYYDFQSETRILLPGTRESSFLGATAIHESVHLSMFGTTSFGQFQKTLAFLIRHGTSFANAELECLRSIFDASIEASLALHEGVATYCQSVFLSFLVSKQHVSEWLGTKPPLYRNNCLLFSEMVESLELTVLTTDEVAKALAESALQTSIIETLPQVLTRPATILSLIEKAHPNNRMMSLHAFLMKRDNREQLQRLVTANVAALDAASSVLGGSTNRKNHDRYLAVKRAIGALVYPVYLDGDSFTYLPRVLDYFKQLRDSLVARGHQEFADWEYGIGDLQELEGNVQFEAPEEPMGEYHVSANALTTTQVVKLLARDSKRKLLTPEWYVHLFPPHVNGRSSAFFSSLEQNEEPILLANHLQEDPPSIENEIMVLRLAAEHVEEAILTAEEDAVILTTSFKHWNSPLSLFGAILRRLDENRRIHYYLLDHSISGLRDFVVSVCSGENWRFYALPDKKHHMQFIFFGEKGKRSAFFSPIAPYTWVRFLDWSADNCPHLREGDEKEALEFSEGQDFGFRIGHYVSFGF